MSILSLASAALSLKSLAKAAKSPAPKATPIAKPITTPQSPMVGDVVVPEVQASMGGVTLPDTTKTYREAITNIDQAKEADKQKMLLGDYEAFATEREFGRDSQSFFDTYFTGKSKESAFDTEVQDIRISKGATTNIQQLSSLPTEAANAKKSLDTIRVNIENFRTPGNKIEENIKKNLGDKYAEFRENIDMESDYVDALRSDEQLRKDIPTFTRSMYNGLGFDWIVDKATGGNTRALNNAANFLNSTGELEENGIVKFAGQLTGDAPVYLASSVFGAAAAGEGMVAIGSATNSARTVGVGLDILKMQKVSPYLYAATFDSAFNTAAEYGIRKASGLDYTIEDTIRSAVMGAIVPKAIGEVAGVVSKSIKYGVDAIEGLIKPKDFKLLDKIIKEGNELGETSLKQILENNSSVKLSNGKTIGEVIDSLPKATKSLSFNEVDVAMSLGNEGITTSSLAARRIADYITTTNKLIDNGSMVNERASTVNDIMTGIRQNKVLDEEKVVGIIKNAEKNNGVLAPKGEIVKSSEDVVSDLLHKESFDIKELKKSSDIEDIYKTFTGEDKIKIDDIDNARVAIDTQNRGGAKSVEELAKREGISFDWDKAIDKFGVTNKPYLNDLMDKVESSVIGYNSFSKKILSSFKEKIKLTRKNLKSATKIDLIGLGKVAQDDVSALAKDVNVLTRRLKLATDVKTKASIAETITKKNLQIDNLKAKYAAKDADKKAIVSLIRGEIESVSNRGEFSVLRPSEIKAIKDAHKARIVGKTTEEQAQAVVDSLANSLYKASYKKLIKVISTQIKKANKQVTSKTKPSRLDPYFVRLMNDAADAMKGTPDLNALHEIKMKLDTFEKLGKDVKTSNDRMVATTSNSDLVQIANELNTKGKERIQVPGYNTPISGVGRKKMITENIRSFVENNIQSQNAIERMFGEGSHGVKVFDIEPRASISQFLLRKDRVINEVVPGILNSLKEGKRISGDFDSIKNKVTMWRLRNSGGHDYNLWNDMVLKLDANGKWEFAPIADAANIEGKSGYIKFQTMPIEQRESILQNWYKEFDNEFIVNTKFAKFENELRTHFDNVGDGITDKMRRLAGKEFPKNANHHPAVLRNKGTSSAIVDENMSYNNFYKDVIKDGFANERVPVKGVLQVNTDFYQTINHHLNTATYWNEIIEPLVRMEKLHTKLKSGRIKEEVLSESQILDFERFMNKTSDEIEGGGMLSPEADSYLRLHVGKLATQGGNLRNIVSADAFATVSKIQSHVVPTMLGGIKTVFKQLGSIPDAYGMGGVANGASALRSTTSMVNPGRTVDNIEAAINSSGYLRERLPQFMINEGAGRALETQGNKTPWTRGAEFRNETLSKIVGAGIRTTDGLSSINAWFVGMSKYLDETHPTLPDGTPIHTAGKPMDIGAVKSQMSPSEWKLAVGYADTFMSKVMGSNHIYDQGVSSQEIISKGVFFLGKTGLNRTIGWINQFAKVLSRNPDIGAGDRAMAAATLTLNIAGNYVLYRAIYDGYAQIADAIGAKSQEDSDKIYSWLGREIQNPDFMDKFWEEVWFVGNMMAVAPSTGLDLSSGFSPLVQYGKKVMNAPTIGRKVEEASYMFVNGVTGIHNDWINLGRKGLSEVSELAGLNPRFTNVENKAFDAQVNSILQTVNDGKTPTTSEMIAGVTKDGIRIPTREALYGLLPTAKATMESSTKLNADNKVKGDVRDEFVSNFLKEYPTATKQDFIKYSQANKDKLQLLGITESSQIVSLYTAAETTKVKSKGEEISLLMGKPVKVIFDVKILPLIEKGDRQGAIAEAKRLMESGVIKSRSGGEELVKLMNQH